MGRRLAHRLFPIGLAAFVIACLLVLPVGAFAADGRHYTFYNPNPTFRGNLDGLAEVVANGQRSLVLDRTTIWRYEVSVGGSANSVIPLTDGGILIADSAGKRAIEVSRAKNVVWSFDRSDYPTLTGVNFVRPTANGYVVVDTKGRRVLQVGSDKNVTWDFGAGDDPNLQAPSSAQVLDDGSVLIADPTGGRVMQVSHGKNEVWHFTSADSPVQATRLSNGDTLVVDRGGDQVVAVAPTGEVTWSFGEKGVAGSDKMHLDSPKSAQRLSDGSTLIADAGNKRVLLVSAQGSVSEVHGTGSPFDAEKDLTATGGASLVADGLLTADSDSGVVTITGYRSSGSYDTGELDLGIPGVDKWVTEILPSVVAKAGTSVNVNYSVGGGAWKSAGAGDGFRVVDPRPAKTLRIRVDFATSDPGASPVLSAVNAAFYLTEPPKWVPPKKKPKGGGTSSGLTVGSSSGNGTGGTGSGSGSGSGTHGSSSSGSSSGSGSSSSSSSNGSNSSSNAVPQEVADNVPVGAANSMHKGFVMDEKKDSSPSGGPTGADNKSPDAPADIIGLTASSLVLTLAFAIGLFGTQLNPLLVRANAFAWSAIANRINP